MAIVQFAFANVNDPFVPIGFFSHPTFRAREVVFGQYAGDHSLIQRECSGRCSGRS
jgi:hypothetical protein